MTNPPSTDTPAGIVTAFIAAVEGHDLEGAIAFLADDVEYDNVPIAKVHGHDGVRAVLEPFVARFDEIAWPVSHLIESGTADDGSVFTERVDRFRSADQWLQLPVAGLFVLRGGKITLWRDYFDLGGFTAEMAKLG